LAKGTGIAWVSTDSGRLHEVAFPVHHRPGRERRVVTVISTESNIATLINVFTVEPERQQELVDLLERATQEVIGHLPGFISANFHASLDGTRVVNYAQWETADALHAMLSNPDAQEHLRAATAIASSDPRLYRVVSVHHV
jgi:quinol monooxygenase YgiN